MKIALISIWHNAKKHKKTQKTRLTKDSKIPLWNKINFFSTCSDDFVTSDVLGFGKIKKKKKRKDDEEKQQLGNLSFFQALYCKFVYNLIIRRISSIYLNFGNLLKEN